MFGGRLRFRGDALREAILRTFEVEASAPDELALAIVAWRAEDGSPAISVNVGWRGDPEGGTAAIRALADHPACYETDLKAMREGYVSVTPLHLDLTHRESMAGLKAALAGMA